MKQIDSNSTTDSYKRNYYNTDYRARFMYVLKSFQ